MTEKIQRGTNDSELQETLSSIHFSPIATVVTNYRLPNNPIIAVNEAFTRLTGYTAEEAIGRNCRFLGGPDTEKENKELLRAAIANEGQIVTELTNYRKDGSKFCNAIMVAPILDENGRTVYFIGSQMAVSSAGLENRQRRNEAKAMIAGLTPRQAQVLALMADGLRNKDIAAKLSVSEKTVKLHRSLALQNLGAQTSGDAIRIAVEAGLTSFGES